MTEDSSHQNDLLDKAIAAKAWELLEAAKIMPGEKTEDQKCRIIAQRYSGLFFDSMKSFIAHDAEHNEKIRDALINEYTMHATIKDLPPIRTPRNYAETQLTPRGDFTALKEAIVRASIDATTLIERGLQAHAISGIPTEKYQKFIDRRNQFARSCTDHGLQNIIKQTYKKIQDIWDFQYPVLIGESPPARPTEEYIPDDNSIAGRDHSDKGDQSKPAYDGVGAQVINLFEKREARRRHSTNPTQKE